MNRLLGVAILAALAYFGYTWVWPRLSGEPPGRSAAKSEAQDEEAMRQARQCVAEASGVTDLVTGEIRGLKPGVDPAAWQTVFMVLVSETARVRSLCACPAAACGRAGQAVDELNEMVLEINGALRGDSGGWSNPATRQERVFRLLDEARRLL